MRCEVGVFDLHLKILPRAQAVILGGDVLVVHHHREILHRLFAVESSDDAVFFGIREQGLLVLAVFDFGAEVGGIDQHHALLVGVVDKQDGDVCAGGGEDVAGHGDHASKHFVVHQMLTNFSFDTALCGDEAGGYNHRRFAAGFQRIDDVLEKEQIDGHLIFLFCRNFRHPGEEAYLMFLGVQLIPEIAEIHLERRIGNDVIKLL